MDEFSESDLVQIIQRNDIFPLLLTRTHLPRLRRTTKQDPVLVQFMGSQDGRPLPATLRTLRCVQVVPTRARPGLDNDERVWGTPSGVNFEYLAVGQVSQSAQWAVSARLHCSSVIVGC